MARKKVYAVRSDSGIPHKYPTTRVQRVLPLNPDGTKMKSPKRIRMQEMQLKLMGYAPPHTALYTITYNKTRSSRYQYIDVFCINNNRLFKITKIVAFILGFRMFKSKVACYGIDSMCVRTYREYTAFSRKDITDIEVNFIKMLAKKMYNDENAYYHESVVMMTSEYEKDAEQIENHTPRKSYIATSV